MYLNLRYHDNIKPSEYRILQDEQPDDDAEDTEQPPGFYDPRYEDIDNYPPQVEADETPSYQEPDKPDKGLTTTPAKKPLPDTFSYENVSDISGEKWPHRSIEERTSLFPSLHQDLPTEVSATRLPDSRGFVQLSEHQFRSDSFEHPSLPKLESSSKESELPLNHSQVSQFQLPFPSAQSDITQQPSRTQQYPPYQFAQQDIHKGPSTTQQYPPYQPAQLDIHQKPSHTQQHPPYPTESMTSQFSQLPSSTNVLLNLAPPDHMLRSSWTHLPDQQQIITPDYLQPPFLQQLEPAQPDYPQRPSVTDFLSSVQQQTTAQPDYSQQSSRTRVQEQLKPAVVKDPPQHPSSMHFEPVVWPDIPMQPEQKGRQELARTELLERPSLSKVAQQPIQPESESSVEEEVVKPDYSKPSTTLRPSLTHIEGNMARSDFADKSIELERTVAPCQLWAGDAYWLDSETRTPLKFKEKELRRPLQVFSCSSTELTSDSCTDFTEDICGQYKRAQTPPCDRMPLVRSLIAKQRISQADRLGLTGQHFGQRSSLAVSPDGNLICSPSKLKDKEMLLPGKEIICIDQRDKNVTDERGMNSQLSFIKSDDTSSTSEDSDSIENEIQGASNFLNQPIAKRYVQPDKLDKARHHRHGYKSEKTRTPSSQYQQESEDMSSSIDEQKNEDMLSAFQQAWKIVQNEDLQTSESTEIITDALIKNMKAEYAHKRSIVSLGTGSHESSPKQQTSSDLCILAKKKAESQPIKPRRVLEAIESLQHLLQSAKDKAVQQRERPKSPTQQVMQAETRSPWLAAREELQGLYNKRQVAHYPPAIITSDATAIKEKVPKAKEQCYMSAPASSIDTEHEETSETWQELSTADESTNTPVHNEPLQQTRTHFPPKLKRMPQTSMEHIYGQVCGEEAPSGSEFHIQNQVPTKDTRSKTSPTQLREKDLRLKQDTTRNSTLIELNSEYYRGSKDNLPRKCDLIGRKTPSSISLDEMSQELGSLISNISGTPSKYRNESMLQQSIRELKSFGKQQKRIHDANLPQVDLPRARSQVSLSKSDDINLTDILIQQLKAGYAHERGKWPYEKANHVLGHKKYMSTDQLKLSGDYKEPLTIMPRRSSSSIELSLEYSTDSTQDFYRRRPSQERMPVPSFKRTVAGEKYPDDQMTSQLHATPRYQSGAEIKPLEMKTFTGDKYSEDQLSAQLHARPRDQLGSEVEPTEMKTFTGRKYSLDQSTVQLHAKPSYQIGAEIKPLEMKTFTGEKYVDDQLRTQLHTTPRHKSDAGGEPKEMQNFLLQPSHAYIHSEALTPDSAHKPSQAHVRSGALKSDFAIHAEHSDDQLTAQLHATPRYQLSAEVESTEMKTFTREEHSLDQLTSQLHAAPSYQIGADIKPIEMKTSFTGEKHSLDQVTQQLHAAPNYQLSEEGEPMEMKTFTGEKHSLEQLTAQLHTAPSYQLGAEIKPIELKISTGKKYPDGQLASQLHATPRPQLSAEVEPIDMKTFTREKHYPDQLAAQLHATPKYQLDAEVETIEMMTTCPSHRSKTPFGPASEMKSSLCDRLTFPDDKTLSLLQRKIQACGSASGDQLRSSDFKNSSEGESVSGSESKVRHLRFRISDDASASGSESKVSHLRFRIPADESLHESVLQPLDSMIRCKDLPIPDAHLKQLIPRTQVRADGSASKTDLTQLTRRMRFGDISVTDFEWMPLVKSDSRVKLLNQAGTTRPDPAGEPSCPLDLSDSLKQGFTHQSLCARLQLDMLRPDTSLQPPCIKHTDDVQIDDSQPDSALDDSRPDPGIRLPDVQHTHSTKRDLVLKPSYASIQPGVSKPYFLRRRLSILFESDTSLTERLETDLPVEPAQTQICSGECHPGPALHPSLTQDLMGASEPDSPLQISHSHTQSEASSSDSSSHHSHTQSEVSSSYYSSHQSHTQSEASPYVSSSHQSHTQSEASPTDSSSHQSHTQSEASPSDSSFHQSQIDIQSDHKKPEFALVSSSIVLSQHSPDVAKPSPSDSSLHQSQIYIQPDQKKPESPVSSSVVLSQHSSDVAKPSPPESSFQQSQINIHSAHKKPEFVPVLFSVKSSQQSSDVAQSPSESSLHQSPDTQSDPEKPDFVPVLSSVKSSQQSSDIAQSPSESSLRQSSDTQSDPEKPDFVPVLSSVKSSQQSSDVAQSPPESSSHQSHSQSETSPFDSSFHQSQIDIQSDHKKPEFPALLQHLSDVAKAPPSKSSFRQSLDPEKPGFALVSSSVVFSQRFSDVAKPDFQS